MNAIRFAAPALVLALAAPAVPAAEKQPHGLAVLYQAAAERLAASKSQESSAGVTSAGAAAARSPVHAVMRVHRRADGSFGVICETEPLNALRPVGTDGPARVRHQR